MTPVAVEVHVGPEMSLPDPYVQRRGLTGAVQAVGWRRLGVSARASGWPVLGASDLSGRGQALVEGNELVPTLSRATWQAVAALEVAPLVVTGERLDAALWLGVTGGVIRTVDDWELLDLPEESAGAVHAVYGWSAALQVGGGHLGVRARLARSQWSEDFADLPDERRGALWQSVELVIRP